MPMRQGSSSAIRFIRSSRRTRRTRTQRPFRSTPCNWKTFLAKSTPRTWTFMCISLLIRRHKWKAKFGGLDVSDARRLKALEDENAKLKKLLAETMLDIAILKDINSRKW